MADTSSFVSRILLCFVLGELLFFTSAKWVKSSIDTNDNWRFLSRFCFLSEDGRFDYNFIYPQNCSARVSVLSKAFQQIIDLTDQQNTGSRSAGCVVFLRDGESYYNCTDSVSFTAARERWWYISVAHCESSGGGKSGLKLDYTLHMMNGAPGDFLHYELSADEFYIVPVDIAFLLLYFILLIISIICAVLLYNRQMFHTTYRLYMASLSLWIFGLLLLCISWGRYSASGWEEGPMEVTGRLFQATSGVVFVLMLILMAKGFTITRGRLTQMSTVRLMVFFSIYIVVYSVLFIWEGVFFDEGYVLYFYESPPGYGLISMRLIGWLWLLYAVFFTMKHHPDKASFYIPFVIFYTVWFWAGPVVILIAIFSMAKWSREKTVNGVEQFVALCGHLFFLVLTRPSAANNNFPYHLRVSQIHFADSDSEPTDTYILSEESKRHMDNLFGVQQQQQKNAAAQQRSTSAPGENIGHTNRGYHGDSDRDNGDMNGDNGAMAEWLKHRTSDPKAIRSNCSILDVYVSYTNPRPNAAIYAEKFTVSDGKPAFLTMEQQHHGLPVYITVLGTRLPNATAQLVNCSDFTYQMNFETVKHRKPIENPCTPAHLSRYELVHPHPYSTNHFIRCDLLGHMYITLCPDKEVFNKVTLSCGFDNQVVPLPGNYRNPCSRDTITNGVYFFAYANDKHKYIQCDIWGGAWLKDCISGNVWNDHAHTCVPDTLHEFDKTTVAPFQVSNPCTPPGSGCGDPFLPSPLRPHSLHPLRHCRQLLHPVVSCYFVFRSCHVRLFAL
ncbi:hypothetical protein ACOMHN_062051 [Nucella lapillus]